MQIKSRLIARGSINETFTSVIYKCSYCFGVQKQITLLHKFYKIHPEASGFCYSTSEFCSYMITCLSWAYNVSWENLRFQRNCNQCSSFWASWNGFWACTCYSLPERKAVIVTFFAPCDWKKFPCMHQSLTISLVAVDFTIDLFHKGSLLIYSFICMIISLSDLVWK